MANNDNDTVLVGDVRTHIRRALTMLDQVDNLIESNDEHDRTIAVGLLWGACRELRTFSEKLC